MNDDFILEKETPLEEKALAFTHNIEESILHVGIHSIFGPVEITDFMVTTMTVMITTTLESPFSLDIEPSNLKLPAYLRISDKNKRGFFNCVMCHYEKDNHNKGVKIFSNGQLHITGNKTVQEAIDCGRDIYASIGRKETIDNFEVQMINGHFKFLIKEGTFIRLSVLHRLCIENHPEYISRYNPENHAGLIIRIPIANRFVTLVFFESGSVLINAFMDGTQLLEAYQFAVTLIDTHHGVIIGNTGEQRDGGSKDGVSAKRRKGSHSSSFDYGKYIVLK